MLSHILVVICNFYKEWKLIGLTNRYLFLDKSIFERFSQSWRKLSKEGKRIIIR